MEMLPTRREFLKLPPVAGQEVRRRNVYFNSVEAGTYNGTTNKIVRFNVPQTQSWGDLANSYITFEATAINDSLDPAGATALIRRWTIRNNGVVLEQKDNVNVEASLLVKALPDDWKASNGRYYGLGSASERLAQAVEATANGYRFMLPVWWSGFFSANEYLPLKYMGMNSGIAMEIEFELESPDVACLDSASAGSFTLQDFRLYVDLVDINQNVDMRIMRGLQDSQALGLRMTQSNCILQEVGTGTQQVIRFSVFKRSLKALLFFMRTSTQTSSKTDSSLSVWSVNNLKDFQVRLNDVEVPESFVRTDKGGVNAYAELLKALGLYRQFMSGSQLKKNYSDVAGGNGEDFCFAVSLDRYLDQGEIESGIDTRVKASPLEVVMNFNSAPTAGNIAIIPVWDAHLIVSGGYVRVDD